MRAPRFRLSTRRTALLVAASALVLAAVVSAERWRVGRTVGRYRHRADLCTVLEQKCVREAAAADQRAEQCASWAEEAERRGDADEARFRSGLVRHYRGEAGAARTRAARWAAERSRYWNAADRPWEPLPPPTTPVKLSSGANLLP